MIPADELSSIMETAHSSDPPQNARRLLKALKSAEQGGGRVSSVEKLRRATGLARKG